MSYDFGPYLNQINHHQILENIPVSVTVQEKNAASQKPSEQDKLRKRLQLQANELTGHLNLLTKGAVKPDKGMVEKVSDELQLRKMSIPDGFRQEFQPKVNALQRQVDELFYDSSFKKNNGDFNDWLDGVLPAFGSIDSKNNAFYLQLIGAIATYQQRLNEVNDKLAEALRDATIKDGKYEFDQIKINALINSATGNNFSNVTITLPSGLSAKDIATLLEGTGLTANNINGNTCFFNFDPSPTIHNALHDCFNGRTATTEALAQMQKRLDQKQAEFDSKTKKVSNKAEHSDSVYKNTQEFISNLLRSMIDLIMDLFSKVK